MSTQEAAILAVQDIVSAIPGIHAAPDYPPETMNDFPFAVAYPGDGNHTVGTLVNNTGERKFLGQIVLEVHVSRADLPSAVQASIGFGDSIPNALLKNPTLNGTISTFESITQTFGELDWDSAQTLGYRFIINGVKQLTTIT